MPRSGRPKLNNPRSDSVYIRLTKAEHEDIVNYAQTNNLTITQTLIRGFHELKKQSTNR